MKATVKFSVLSLYSNVIMNCLLL